MTDILEAYLAPAFRYNFDQGPQLVRSREDALAHGLNCISLAHLALRDIFDYELPGELHCAEMYLDQQHFTEVGDATQAQRGDLFWFGISGAAQPPEAFQPQYDAAGALVNWREFPVKHVAVHTGDYREDDPLLLHATHRTGTNSVWPLQQFFAYPRYQKLFAVRRLQVGNL